MKTAVHLLNHLYSRFVILYLKDVICLLNFQPNSIIFKTSK